MPGFRSLIITSAAAVGASIASTAFGADPELKALADCIRSFEVTRLTGSLGKSTRPDPVLIPRDTAKGKQRGFFVLTEDAIYRVTGLQQKTGGEPDQVWFTLPNDDRKFFITYNSDPSSEKYHQLISVRHSTMPEGFAKLEANDYLDDQTRKIAVDYAVEGLENFSAYFQGLVGQDRYERSWTSDSASATRTHENAIAELEKEIARLETEKKASGDSGKAKRIARRIDARKEELKDKRFDLKLFQEWDERDRQCGGYEGADKAVARIRATDQHLARVAKSCEGVQHPGLRQKVAAFKQQWDTCRKNTAIPNYLNPIPASPGSAGETQDKKE